ncbi:hypothetical protein N9609_00655 [bacterium]|nr:hypothetical protein [bacterium]
MSLNKIDLKNDIIQIMTDMLQRDSTSIEEFATRLSESIDTYVKDADITYTGGLTAPNGAVSGTFNFTLT